MKLFEDMAEMGGTINSVIQQMVNDMFQQELDDDEVAEIVSKLSLSDLLSLDDAYTSGDKEKIQDILGPLPTMEYSMGGSGREVASAASSRPAARTAAAPAAKKQNTTTQSSSSYSGGVQNGVSTTNIDDETPNDPNAVMQDDEPIEEDDDWDNWDDVEVELGQVISHDHYGDVTVIEVTDDDMYGGAATVLVELPDGSTMEMSYDYLLGATDENEIGEAGIGAPDYNPARGGYDQPDLQRLAQEYQGAMAGMGRRDEQDIIDDMYAIADPDTVDDILNGMGVDVPKFQETTVTENTDSFNSDEVIRAFDSIARESEEEDPMLAAGLSAVANRINQSFPDSVTLADIMNMLREPQLRSVRKDDIEYALQASGIMDMMEDTDNVYEDSGINKKILAKYKKLMPAGSTVETYNGSTRISWSKRGGYAGENSIIRTKEKAMAVGFEKGNTTHSAVPDGSRTGRGTELTDADGATLSYSLSYGSTASSNSYYITLTLPSEPDGSTKEVNVVEMTAWLKRRAGIN